MPKSKTYDEFVEKFKPKLTTDDCFTPPEVYDEVLRFAREIAPIDGRPIVRPFWPGGDFEHFDYPAGCVVVDNPPFSIYASIVRWYIAHGIDFFLFSPSLTQTIIGADVCYIVTGVNVTFENGAKLSIGFTTSLLPRLRLWVSGDLCRRIESVQKAKKPEKTVNAYRFPDNIATIARLQKIAQRGLELMIPSQECQYISKAGEQCISLFGQGFLLSSKAAAEKAAAEKAAAEKAAERDLLPITLTDDELAIIRRIDASDPAGVAPH